jgi:hypothetical protein
MQLELAERAGLQRLVGRLRASSSPRCRAREARDETPQASSGRTAGRTEAWTDASLRSGALPPRRPPAP